MRPFFLFVFLSLFFLNQPLFSQPAGTIDSSRIVVQKTIDSIKEWHDSINRERLLEHIRKNGKSLDQFLAERKETERKEQRRLYIRLGAGVLLLFALFYAIARRKKAKGA